MSQLGRVGARAAAQAGRHVKDRAQQSASSSSSSMARTSKGTARPAALARKTAEEELEKMRKAAAEESLRTVMFLSFWGPNT
ncbi:hypothetical protein BRADI_5g23135v3 [Brachypodium distachyon]|uniref:Uncharacterized protein n=1 Tax=Brachypodium distachyon TaxID=15368 RepID=A0A0Q3EEJ8_BRADI|nr:hypothetical protein BRADI_5g23135v3 [Brachypodium distachyon]